MNSTTLQGSGYMATSYTATNPTGTVYSGGAKSDTQFSRFARPVGADAAIPVFSSNSGHPLFGPQGGVVDDIAASDANVVPQAQSASSGFQLDLLWLAAFGAVVYFAVMR